MARQRLFESLSITVGTACNEKYRFGLNLVPMQYSFGPRYGQGYTIDLISSSLPHFAPLWQLDEVCLQQMENGRDKTCINACGNPERFTFPNLLLKGLMIQSSIALILVPMRDFFKSWYGQACMIINKRVFFLILMLTIRYSWHLDEVAADI